jgi:hypothetical protein
MSCPFWRQQSLRFTNSRRRLELGLLSEQTSAGPDTRRIIVLVGMDEVEVSLVSEVPTIVPSLRAEAGLGESK